MATGLFTPDAEIDFVSQAKRLIDQRNQNRLMNQVQFSPQQQVGLMYGQAGQQLGQALSGLLGYEDPLIVQAKKAEADRARLSETMSSISQIAADQNVTPGSSEYHNIALQALTASDLPGVAAQYQNYMMQNQIQTANLDRAIEKERLSTQLQQERQRSWREANQPIPTNELQIVNARTSGAELQPPGDVFSQLQPPEIDLEEDRELTAERDFPNEEVAAEQAARSEDAATMPVDWSEQDEVIESFDIAPKIRGLSMDSNKEPQFPDVAMQPGQRSPRQDEIINSVLASSLQRGDLEYYNTIIDTMSKAAQIQGKDDWRQIPNGFINLRNMQRVIYNTSLKAENISGAIGYQAMVDDNGKVDHYIRIEKDGNVTRVSPDEIAAEIKANKTPLVTMQQPASQVVLEADLKRLTNNIEKTSSFARNIGLIVDSLGDEKGVFSAIKARMAKYFPNVIAFENIANIVDFAEALRTQLAPTMREEGSGSTSDYEMALFMAAIPNLLMTPSARTRIKYYSGRLAKYHREYEKAYLELVQENPNAIKIAEQAVLDRLKQKFGYETDDISGQLLIFDKKDYQLLLENAPADGVQLIQKDVK